MFGEWIASDNSNLLVLPVGRSGGKRMERFRGVVGNRFGGSVGPDDLIAEPEHDMASFAEVAVHVPRSFWSASPRVGEGHRDGQFPIAVSVGDEPCMHDVMGKPQDSPLSSHGEHGTDWLENARRTESANIAGEFHEAESARADAGADEPDDGDATWPLNGLLTSDDEDGGDDPEDDQPGSGEQQDDAGPLSADQCCAAMGR